MIARFFIRGRGQPRPYPIDDDEGSMEMPEENAVPIEQVDPQASGGNQDAGPSGEYNEDGSEIYHDPSPSEQEEGSGLPENQRIEEREGEEVIVIEAPEDEVAENKESEGEGGSGEGEPETP